MTAIGASDYAYQPIEDSAKVSEGWVLVDVSGVAVDANDNVYVLWRGTHPVLVFDTRCNLVRRWGDGELDNPAHYLVGSKPPVAGQRALPVRQW